MSGRLDSALLREGTLEARTPFARLAASAAAARESASTWPSMRFPAAISLRH
ncbi:MAG: hypothetical protein ACR2OG_08420 [Gemmatimonadaceae bacterium]